MDYKKFWKTISSTFIYLLVAGGAVVMILPFAWMIMTSLKTDGEVNSWPPSWITKNFKSENIVNVIPESSTFSSKGTLSLAEFRTLSKKIEYNPYKVNYFIDDDPLRRGVVTLKINNLTYTDNEKLKVLMNKIFEYLNVNDVRKDLKTKIIDKDLTSENFEKIYFSLFSKEDGYYKKTNIIKNILLDLNKSSKFLEILEQKNINRLPQFRLKSNMTQEEKDEINSSKDKFKSYIISLNDKIKKVSKDIEEYSKGLGIIKFETSKSIELELKNLSNNFIKYNDKILSKTNLLMSKNIYNKVNENILTLNFYNEFFTLYKKIQNKNVNDFVVKFVIPQKKDMYNNIISNIKISDFPKYFKDKVIELASVSKILKLKDNVVNYYENSIINEIKNNYIRNSDELSKIIEILRTLSKNNANLSNANLYISKNDLSLLNKNIKGKEEEFLQTLNKRREYDSLFEKFGTFFENNISKAKILEGNDYIKEVLFKNNSNIVFYTKNMYSSWLFDEKPEVKVKYTFSQVIANIFQNYVDAWNAAPFSKYYANTVLMASMTTILEIIFASMAAFAFAKFNFFGKNFIFSLFLATMMVPGEVMLVPNYITISRFQWIDTYYALIVPWIVSVFAIFLLRQQFMTIPNDLWDAAKIDGSSSWRFLWTVMVPLSKPSIVTGALLKFVGSWNAFLWVLIVTKTPEMRTLAVGLQTFRSESGDIYNLMMAASTFSVLPIVIIFILLQKYFVAGISRSGLKG
ncbi:hypothetical protein OSSY52_14230 [Tepiditoga spiralis]|uniref:ABC transmembrane type-1 domain-containing protein n=1 Tax=Tepiditoga spiralis TaxID=2108365 RepID=A0A7G1GAP9_9BACT|nr:carbohydrate ABC transporter permease [Tepiditoga spiralis]BBE31282.1 hypothetical protein OSSY52_14230 [Tepiditoga spiralis]